MVAICCRYSYWLTQFHFILLVARFASVVLWSAEQQLQHHLEPVRHLNFQSALQTYGNLCLNKPSR